MFCEQMIKLITFQKNIQNLLTFSRVHCTVKVQGGQCFRTQIRRSLSAASVGRTVKYEVPSFNESREMSLCTHPAPHGLAVSVLQQRQYRWKQR